MPRLSLDYQRIPPGEKRASRRLWIILWALLMLAGPLLAFWIWLFLALRRY